MQPVAGGRGGNYRKHSESNMLWPKETLIHSEYTYL
jgi:hypothetical protein